MMEHVTYVNGNANDESNSLLAALLLYGMWRWKLSSRYEEVETKHEAVSFSIYFWFKYN